jgi:hypothetical protein
MELCNLVEQFPTHHDSLEDFLRTEKFAYLYAKTVTLLQTHWPETNAVMKRNMRIGCSMSGLAQFVESKGIDELVKWMDVGYDEVQRRDRQYSAWLGVRESVKTTSIKPSGTVSLLAGVTPGVHWPVAATYIRRMRFGKDDPMLDVLEAAGYHTEPAFGSEGTTVVVEIPVKGPQVRAEKDVPVKEKVSLAVLAQAYWADNQVSATFTFNPGEDGELAAAMKEYDGSLKSLSALKIDPSSYPQMPYQEISNPDYLDSYIGINDVDMDSVYGYAREAVGERFCDTDHCTI